LTIFFSLAPPPDWDTGRCSYYGRAELKQSDHRPVVSVIDIEAFAVDERKRDSIFHDVIKQLGPADATVILRYFKKENQRPQQFIKLHASYLLLMLYIYFFFEIGLRTLQRLNKMKVIK
jgi:hypothetical protein